MGPDGVAVGLFSFPHPGPGTGGAVAAAMSAMGKGGLRLFRGKVAVVLRHRRRWGLGL